MKHVKSCQDISSQGRTQIFWTKNFLDQNLLNQNFFGPKISWTQNFLDPKFFGPKNFLDPNILDPDLYILGIKCLRTNEVTNFGYQILIQKPKCPWDWSLTLALAQLVFILFCFISFGLFYSILFWFSILFHFLLFSFISFDLN